MTQWLNELKSDGGVCRTAPATSGLLIMLGLRYLEIPSIVKEFS